MKKHVILDTDIGGDPDDTLALLLGLVSPEIQIDLIVTSDEYGGVRASFAKKIVKSLNFDIPVARGCDALGDKFCVVDDLSFLKECKTDYLQAIKEAVKRNSKTHYVCIGPQSNLAAFLESNQFSFPKLEVVIMGGAINYRIKGVAEHNVRFDCKAALKVFHSKVCKRYVLSDTTYNPALEIDASHRIYHGLKESKIIVMGDILQSFENYFKAYFNSTMMHDPLTFSDVIEPQFINLEERKITMAESGIMNYSDKGLLQRVSVGADYPGFMEFLEHRPSFI